MIETILSPLRIIIPKTLLISRSGSPFLNMLTHNCLPYFLGFNLLNSSVSLNTTFKCLSNARNVPTIILLSYIVTLTR